MDDINLVIESINNYYRFAIFKNVIIIISSSTCIIRIYSSMNISRSKNYMACLNTILHQCASSQVFS